ncbi:CHAP domain-containing protein [Streptomyces sp. NPDC015131]|uniref:CHAP domain-containing protein n=1 Tax=Streptomyces sp. NPDC015131 TaxID=3364941 RepID=UPI0036FBBC65
MSREAMIAKMESLLGTAGRPNVATRWYAARNGSQFLNAAWCNMAITWAAAQSGNHKAVCFGTDYAWTVAHAQRFQREGRWRTDVAGIARGDIVFFDWAYTNNVAAIDHIGIVTQVVGSKVYTIEGNTANRCARRVRDASTIVGYGRPAYAAVPAPAPAPAAPAPKPQASPAQPASFTPPFPAGLRPDSSRPSARTLQVALKKAGYMAASVPFADNYGPRTQAAVAAFHKANPQFAERPNDPAIGPMGWAELHREAYAKSGATQPAPPPAPAPKPPAAAPGEPAHDYRRTTYGGRTVNQRTKVMLEQAAERFGGTFRLSQGSYSTGVAASAGTHDGGGVVDIASSSNTLLKALRQVGFAAWVRSPAEGFSWHIHACAIGDREMAPGARSQVSAYFNGRNGLRGNGPDSAPASVGRPMPAWASKYRP